MTEGDRDGPAGAWPRVGQVRWLAPLIQDSKLWLVIDQPRHRQPLLLPEAQPAQTFFTKKPSSLSGTAERRPKWERVKWERARPVFPVHRGFQDAGNGCKVCKVNPLEDGCERFN